MPIFALNDENIFPPVDLSEENGILAVGGDLTPERLINAYSNGIFPWYSEGDPIIWWSPDPRFVLFPDRLKISKSMRQVLKRNQFKITFDTSFEQVITACSKPRKTQDGTWITNEMIEAYKKVHSLGLAHSVEAWSNGKLAGGLYGISLGRCFFGESMFTEVTNASKAAFISLIQKLQEYGFLIIDCQVYTKHLESLGAIDIPRYEFMEFLKIGLQKETIQGNWGELFHAPPEKK